MFLTIINISLVCVVATMHVSAQIILVVVLLTYGASTSPASVENTTVDLVPPATEEIVPVPKNCTTGHGTPGGCVERAYCDYGTPGIDFTSYAPRGYQKYCSDKEVCCPFGSQLPVPPKKKPTDNEDFNFDDEDD